MSNPDSFHLTIVAPSNNSLAQIGQVANAYAARNVFADYLSRKADNTIRRQAADLTRFVEFLNQVGEQAGLQLGTNLGAFAQAVGTFPDGPGLDADAWRGVTWGLVEGFRKYPDEKAGEGSGRRPGSGETEVVGALVNEIG